MVLAGGGENPLLSDGEDENLSLVTLIPLRNLLVPVLTGGLDKTPYIRDFFFLTHRSLLCIFNSF